jgi:hypothetical protein
MEQLSLNGDTPTMSQGDIVSRYVCKQLRRAFFGRRPGRPSGAQLFPLAVVTL